MTTGQKIGLTVAVVALVAVIAVALSLNAIVKRGIEHGSERAVGLSTKVGSVSLGILKGNFGMSSFQIKNPEGFQADNIITLRDSRLSVGLPSILADTVVVDNLTLRGIELNLELRNTTGNFQPLLDNLERQPSGSEDGGKQLVIKELIIQDITAQISAQAPGLGIDEKLRIETPEIRLTGVGVGGGVNVSQLTSIVVTRVLDAVRRSDDLPSALESLLGERVSDLIERHRELIQEADVKALAEEKTHEAADDVVEEAKDKLQDLLDDGN